VAGQIIDDRTRRPVKPGDATITVSGPSRPGRSIQRYPIEEDGSFHIPLAPGQNEVRFSDFGGWYGLGGQSSATVQIQEGQTEYVEFRVYRPRP
jgi:hypothetical protein